MHIAYSKQRRSFGFVYLFYISRFPPLLFVFFFSFSLFATDYENEKCVVVLRM